jgi:hypothetical protein
MCVTFKNTVNSVIAAHTNLCSDDRYLLWETGNGNINLLNVKRVSTVLVGVKEGAIYWRASWRVQHAGMKGRWHW